MTLIFYEFGDFRLDINRKQLFRRNGEHVQLTPKQFNVLLFLVENKGKTKSYQDLIDRVWGDIFVEEANVTQTVSAIRKALNDLDRPHNYIGTVSKEGYCFTGQVKATYAKPDPDPIPTPVPPIPTPPEPAPVDSKRSETDFLHWIYTHKVFVIFLFACVVSSLLISWLVASSTSVNLSGDEATKATSQIFTISGCVTHIVVIFAAFLYYQLFLKARKFRPIEEDSDKDGELKIEIKSLGYRSETEWKRARKIAQMAFDQYKKYWNGLLAVWFVLYLFLSLSFLPQLQYPQITALAINLVNNLNTLMGLLCFGTLYKTVRTDNEELVIRDSYLSIGLLSVLLWMAFEVFFLSIFGQLNLPLFENASNYEGPIVLWFSSLLSGLLGGVMMALFIGRLQSKLLGISVWILFTLYFYIVLQPLFIFFHKPTYTSIIINVALILKCLLILVMFWLLQSGRLFYYFVRVRPDYEKERNGFEDLLR